MVSGGKINIRRVKRRRKDQMGEKFVVMQGDEACARGAILAGCRFFAGYPITPATDIAEVMSAKLPKVDGTFIQMEDELSSAAAIIGASLAGVKSMTSTSGPGFSLMQEAIGYASMTETPVVFVDVQRAGPSTGFPTKTAQGDIMQSRWGTHGDHAVIVLYPSTVEEVYKHIVTAFNFSEIYRTPVIFLMDETIGHMRESFYLPDPDEFTIVDRITTKDVDQNTIYQPFLEESELNDEIQPLVSMGSTRFHVSGLFHDESGFPIGSADMASKLMKHFVNKINLHLDEILIYDSYMVDDAEYLIVAYGITARSAYRAIKLARANGIKVGLFKPITIWPFPANPLKKLISRISGIVVAEMNMGQFAHEVSRINKKNVPMETVFREDGELIQPYDIVEALSRLTNENEE